MRDHYCHILFTFEQNAKKMRAHFMPMSVSLHGGCHTIVPDRPDVHGAPTGSPGGGPPTTADTQEGAAEPTASERHLGGAAGIK